MSEGNIFIKLCDDIVIYISFYLFPKDIVKLRLLDKYTNNILESCDYLWKKFLVCNNASRWKELCHDSNSNPPHPYEDWFSCFLVNFNSLMDLETGLCFRLNRKTTTKFLSQNCMTSYRHGWKSTKRWIRMLKLQNLHVRILNTTNNEREINLSRLELCGCLYEKSTGKKMPMGLHGHKLVDESKSPEEGEMPNEFQSVESGFYVIDPHSTLDFFVSGSVWHEHLGKYFDTSKAIGGNAFVETLDFYVTKRGCLSQSNRIPVKSGTHYYSLQGMTKVQSRLIKKELSEYFTKKSLEKRE